MVLVCVSPRNPLHTRLTMEEKWKAVNIETDEEEKDLEDLIIKEGEDEGMEEETKPTPSNEAAHLYPPMEGED